MTESGDEDVMIQANERIPLLSDSRPEEEHGQELTHWQRLKQRRKRRPVLSAFFCFSAILWSIFIIVVASILIAYLAVYLGFVKDLRVLALNCWGMPGNTVHLSEDKELRMKHIGDMIAKAEYDVYLLSELWMRPDHETIRQRLPPGYFMTEVGDFALPTCDGRVLPSFCSGLAIVSRHPFIEKQFLEYSYHGDILKPDGEYWARKGAGRARIAIQESFVVDLFVTHTCAVGNGYSNAYYRTNQVKELVGWLGQATGDFTVLGGDFNTDPRDNETSYSDLKSLMVSSIEEFFLDIKSWLAPDRATYGNPRNSYSNMYSPVLYDYVWHKAAGPNLIWTNFFDVPWLTCVKNIFHPDKNETRTINLSDHEAVTSHLYLFKPLNMNILNKLFNFFHHL